MTNIPDIKSREIAKTLWEVLEEFFEEELVEMIHQWQEVHS